MCCAGLELWGAVLVLTVRYGTYRTVRTVQIDVDGTQCANPPYMYLQYRYPAASSGFHAAKSTGRRKSQVMACLLNLHHAWKREEEHKPMPVTCAGMFHQRLPRRTDF